MTTDQSFEEIVKILPSTNKIQAILKKATKNYNILQYKINFLSLRQVRKTLGFFQRPQPSSTIFLSETDWYPKQLKCFVWVLIVLSALYNLEVYQLLEAQSSNTQQVWTLLRSVFPRKHPYLLYYQGNCLLKSKISRNWSNAQDKLLLKSIKQVPSQQRFYWNQIAKKMYFSSEAHLFKSAKHCRDRWLNHLDPKRVKKNWSSAEDELIIKYVEEFGGQWSKIAQKTENRRTDHDIKNRYHSLLKASKIKKRNLEICSKETQNINTNKNLKQESILKHKGVQKFNKKDNENSQNKTYQNSCIELTQTRYDNQDDERRISLQRLKQDICWWNQPEGLYFQEESNLMHDERLMPSMK